MVLFGGLEEAGDDVMPARGRTARKDKAQAPGFGAYFASGDDFQQLVLADKGQLLMGDFQDLQVKAVQKPGGTRTRGQGRAEDRLVSAAFFAKLGVIA